MKIHRPYRNCFSHGRTRLSLGAAGFTLLEVMVALMVLAVGALGIAAMQLRGLQYNHDAYLRSQISVLAYDMSDRMRLNRALAGSYASTYTIPTTAPTGCQTALATPANDLVCWQSQLFDALPPGSTAVIAAAGNEYTIDIAWTDREGSARSIEYTFQL